MASSTLRDRPALLIGAGVIAAALVIGLAIWLSGSEGDDEPSTAADRGEQEQELDYELEPGPRLDPEPRPVPVSGEVEVADPVDVSVSGNRVFEEGREENEPVPVDEDAIDELVQAIAALLDEHLDALQHGESTPLADHGLEGEDDVLVLADEERWVRTAHYTVTVYVRGEPEWASVDVEVERNDGSLATATFGFLAGDEPTLIAAESDLPSAGDGPTVDEGSAGDDGGNA